MSANYSVRSLGQPYFGLVQTDLSGMDATGLGGLGLAWARIEVRVHALPQQYAADDELHPLFSLHEWGGSGQILHELGLTPSGSVGAVVKSGAAATSLPARILPDGLWHTIESLYSAGTGALAVKLDGVTVATASGAAGALAPSAGRIGRLLLFNGLKGLTRCDCSIRRVDASTASASSGYAISWPMDKREARVIEPVATDFPAISAGLAAAWYDPLVWPRLYGAVPDGDPGEAYRWAVETAWERKVVERTTWTKVVSA